MHADVRVASLPYFMFHAFLSFLPSFLPSFLSYLHLPLLPRHPDSIELVRLYSTTLMIRPDVPVGVGRFSVSFAAVWTLKPWLLAAFVSKMCQHVRLLTKRAATSRTKVSLNLLRLSRPRLLNVPCKRQANHRRYQYAWSAQSARCVVSESTISVAKLQGSWILFDRFVSG